MAGARMLTNYPTSIVVHGMALNITVQSYDQSLDFGLMADAAALPDVKALAQAITLAFDELRALPAPDALPPQKMQVASAAEPAAPAGKARKRAPSAGHGVRSSARKPAVRTAKQRSTP
jgi:hypothetical protein